VRPDGTRVAFAINYLKGKWLKIGRCANPDQIFKTNKKREVHYDTGKPVTICDVWGHFQLSFQGALHGMRKNIEMSDDELALIEWGKPLRGDFSNQPIDKIKAYTETEVKLTCRMMKAVHAGLAAFGAKITKWHGPGPVAKFFLNAKGIAPSKEHPGHYPELRSVDPRTPQKWTHHAFFGGRIELIKQGTHKGPLYGYDLCSAYPAAMADLPSMREGKWKTYRAKNLSLAELKSLVERFSRVSMVRVKFDFGTTFSDNCQHLFYPLPFRQEDGAVIFPQHGEGIYMRDEILAMIEWCERMPRRTGLGKGYDGILPKIEFKGAQEFIPGNDEKPFAFVRELFDLRSKIIAESERTGIPDIREKVIKLVLNSLYGKMAEAVGSRNDGKPPPTANPFYAAAITAWTRAQLLKAALHDPENIVMFCTDGIISTAPLRGPGKLETVTEKVLGAWEFKPSTDVSEAGVFVMAGIYSFFEMKNGKAKENTKTRGFKIATPREYLLDDVRKAWRQRQKTIEGPYKKYITIGAAVSSPENWLKCGCWCEGTRAMAIDGAGLKRLAPRGRPERANRLLDTLPADNIWRSGPKKGMPDEELSRIYKPEWLDVAYGEEQCEDREQLELMLSRYDEGLDEDVEGGRL
jgi:hypothetical protein